MNRKCLITFWFMYMNIESRWVVIFDHFEFWMNLIQHINMVKMSLQTNIKYRYIYYVLNNSKKWSIQWNRSQIDSVYIDTQNNVRMYTIDILFSSSLWHDKCARPRYKYVHVSHCSWNRNRWWRWITITLTIVYHQDI